MIEIQKHILYLIIIKKRENSHKIGITIECTNFLWQNIITKKVKLHKSRE